VTLFAEYTDPRLVPLYDTVCPFAADTIFYLEFAVTLRASVIVDIGCGTGRLSAELARRGHRVTGVDPSAAMLEIARQRPGGEQVRWIEGDASQINVTGADLVIMTGHVAQVISDQTEWANTLNAAQAALQPGGHLIFETRDPCAQVWASGKDYALPRRYEGPGVPPFSMWQESVELDGELAHFELHYLLGQEEVISKNTLRFRTESELRDELKTAGFDVEHVFGDWDHGPVGEGTTELIFVAARRQ
jgi:2-polyprenyl-3-methyl-5-hydroxy-6-metoxy-1,4-benzoquinol methylase